MDQPIEDRLVQPSPLVAATDRLFLFCASLKLAVTSISLLAVVLAVATFYESSYGMLPVGRMIYGSWWFTALLAMLAVNVFAAAMIRYPWKRHQIGFLITHAGLLVLLAGCVVGFQRSLDGMLVIEEGKSARQVQLRTAHVSMRYDGPDARAQAWMRMDPMPRAYPSPVRYLASPLLGVPEPNWPDHFEQSIDPDPAFAEAIGQPVSVEVIDWLHAARPTGRMQPGDHGGPAVRLAIEGSTPMGAPVSEQLWLWRDGAHHHDHAGHNHDHGNATPGPEGGVGPMRVRLVELPEEEGAAEAFLAGETLPTLGEGVRGLIEIAIDPQGQLFGRRISSSDGQTWSGPLELGQPQEAFMGLSLRVDQLLPTAAWAGGFEKVKLAPGQTGTAAARLRVTVGDQVREVWAAQGGQPTVVRVGEASLSIRYGLDHVPLPFAVALERFERRVDPGTDRAASFASHVRVVDTEGRRLDGEALTVISMNEPLSRGGMKFYQSGFQQLPSGGAVTVLTVNRDPGRPVKYAGCLMVVLGIFTMFYMRAYFFKKPNPAAAASRARGGAAQVASVCVLLLAGLAMAGPARAQDSADQAQGYGFAAPQPVLGEAALDAMSRLGVMHQGRLMPVESVARRTVRQITGRERFAVGDGQKRDPVSLMLSVMSDPPLWLHAPMVQAQLIELREWLGVSAEGSHVSLSVLDEHGEFWGRARHLGHEEAQADEEGLAFEPSRLDEAIMDTARRAGTMRMMMQGAPLGVLAYPGDDAFFEYLQLQSRQAQPTPVAQRALTAWQSTPAGFTDAQRRDWFASHAGYVTLDALLATPPSQLPASAAQRWARGGELWAVLLESIRQQDGAAADQAALTLAAEWPALRGDVIDQGRVDLEVFYNRSHPFRVAFALYLLAAAVLGMAMVSPRRGFYIAGLSLLGLAMAGHVAGFALRVIITGWAPVTNMYETVIWVALVTSAMGLVLELVYRRRIIALMAAIVAAVCTLIAEIMPPGLGAQLQNLQPVLRSNFWLTIHVLTIVSSYAAFALALGLGNVVLGSHLLGKGSRRWRSAMNTYIYRALQVGVLLIAAGTILGGVWADYAWGRFWGWDPKEVWALIVLLVYLAILHGRYAGWTGPFGVAAGSVLGFMSVIMAWYGVNFVLGQGLHSYGFGAGGRGPVLIGVAIQCAFVALAWARYRTAGRSDSQIERPSADTPEIEGGKPVSPGGAT